MAWQSSMLQGFSHSNPVRSVCRTAHQSTCGRSHLATSRRPYRAANMHEANGLAPTRRLVKAAIAAPSPPDTSSPEIIAPVRTTPSSVSNPEPLPLEQAALGLRFYSDGSSTFRVWAPHSTHAVFQVAPPQQGPAPPTSTPEDDATVAAAADQPPWQPTGVKDVPLQRVGDTWACTLPPGSVSNRSPYRVLLHTNDGTVLERRDPYARSADYHSTWCYAHDPSTYTWNCLNHQPPAFDHVIIYEMHIGSFTPEGTLKAAAKKIKHVADLGFTMLELMPCSEFSDPAKWGYSPRQLMALYAGYGTPEDMCAFVDAAHELGLGVMMDVVLHHGAPAGNNLWDYDGWSQDFNGGIYHENAPDTPWGRQWAFWKNEVVDMISETCAMWLGEYRMDGLRFDSIKDVPTEPVQRVTWRLKQEFPGRILTAEITPEDPNLMNEYGFDAIWVHSGYFDIIQQHRALGRGHHGGGDWADGWDLPKLRTAMGVHYGFTTPVQCIKYMTGSHDQVGCQKGGGWYQDYAPIGGQHRFAVDQYCGGRSDPRAVASARLWYAANVGAAGLPMMFMGTEFAQSGWWNTDEWHRFNWDCAEDDIGKGMMAAVRDVNLLRRKYPALRHGWSNCIHEDRMNGIMGYERVADGCERIIVIVNAARGFWQESNYGVWVGGGGTFEQIYCSQDPAYNGDSAFHSNGEVKEYDGRIHLNIPPQCTLMLRQCS